MKVEWTERARERLIAIREYIEEDSLMEALRVVDRLVLSSKTIGISPNKGRKTPEYQRNDIREKLERPYRLIYKIKSDQVDVLTVMHYRQLLPKDLDELLAPCKNQ